MTAQLGCQAIAREIRKCNAREERSSKAWDTPEPLAKVPGEGATTVRAADNSTEMGGAAGKSDIVNLAVRRSRGRHLNTTSGGQSVN